MLDKESLAKWYAKDVFQEGHHSHIERQERKAS